MLGQMASESDSVGYSVMSDYSPPGSSAHGILQARVQEWVPSPCPRGPSRPRGGTQVYCIAGGFFTEAPRGKPIYLQSMPQSDILHTPTREAQSKLKFLYG